MWFHNVGLGFGLGCGLGVGQCDLNHKGEGVSMASWRVSAWVFTHCFH